MNIRPYVSLLLKWSWLIILATGLAAGITYRSVSRIPRVYQATATVLVGRSLQLENPNPDDIRTSQTLAVSYAQLVRSEPVLQATINALKLTQSWNALSPQVNAVAVEGTDLLKISVVDRDPHRAQIIANELAHQLILQSPTPRPGDPQRQFTNDQMAKLQTQIKATQSQIAGLQTKADHTTSATELNDLRNQIDVLQQRVTGWQNTYAQLTNFYQGSTTNYLSLVDPATLPSTPVGTSAKYEILLAGVIGFCLAVGGIVVIEFFDDSFKTHEEVSRTLELPILGGIGRVRRTANGLFATSAPRSSVTEACRYLAANVMFSTTKTNGATALLVTSPGPAEGKSTIASNLGVTLANAGKRVIVIDANLRRPSCHRFFELTNREGLTSLLKDESRPVESALQSTAVANLRVLPSGPLPPNPADLLSSGAMEARLAQLSKLADVIIVDSPAILGAADTVVLGPLCHAVILVVRAGRTRRPIGKQAQEALSKVGLGITGVVFNGAELGRAGYRRYYAPPGPEAAQTGQRQCPFLGLRADRSTTFLGPTAEHRCYAAKRAQSIDLAQQAAACLTGEFVNCARFAQVGVHQMPSSPRPPSPATNPSPDPRT